MNLTIPSTSRVPRLWHLDDVVSNRLHRSQGSIVFQFLACLLGLSCLIGLFDSMACKLPSSTTQHTLQINFRPDPIVRNDSNVTITPTVAWRDAKSIAGWLESNGIEARLRKGVKEPLASFVFAKNANTLRVKAPKGLVSVEIEVGDMSYADKYLGISIPSAPNILLPPIEHLAAGEFARLQWTMQVTDPFVDLIFSAPRKRTWAISSMTIRTAKIPREPSLSRFRPRPRTGSSVWPDAAALSAPKVSIHNDTACKVMDSAMVLRRSEYIDLISKIVEENLANQSVDGRIIDPFEKREIQYATPAFAFAAATVTTALGRSDWKESAILALEKSVEQLRNRQAPDRHEDFYPVMIAHALEQLGDDPRLETLKTQLGSLDPWSLYTTPPGMGNWNVAALAGEFQLHRMGLRSDTTFWKDSLSLQSSHMNNKFGHYLSEENATAYDLFPRVWIGDILYSGLDNSDAAAIAQVWDRAAWMTLLSQSPSGELPGGGRSSSQLWNDAALCALFENAAERAFRDGKHKQAGLYRAAAHLAFSSISNWVQSSSKVPIVKNRIKLPNRHGLEPYAYSTNYSLLSAALLALSHRYFNTKVEESCPLAHTGSFVLDMTATLEKIIANHRGAYLTINTDPQDSNDPVGLVRIDFKHVDQRILIPGGLRKNSSYHVPSGGSRIDAAVSVQWRKHDSDWIGLSRAHRTKNRSGSRSGTAVTVEDVVVTEDSVSFSVAYRGLKDASSVVESYRLSPKKFRINSQVQGTGKQLVRFVAPLSSNDGDSESKIEPNSSGCLEVSTPHSESRIRQIGQVHRVRWCSNAGPLTISRKRYSYRSGWARLLTSQEISSSQPIWLEMTMIE